jgi:hypothetical protein
MAPLAPIEICRLDASDVRAWLDALAAVLVDCVAGGASVSYVSPFTQDEARGAFEAVARDVEQGRRLLLAAFAGEEVVGTVQVISTRPSSARRSE